MISAAFGDPRSSALFEALISTAVDGIIVIDTEGKIQIYNAACERLFGYGLREVVGRNVKVLMPEPYRAEHDGYLANYHSSGEKRIIGIGREVVGRRKDGTTFPMYLSVGEGDAGGNRFFVGIIHDLSEIKAKEKERADSDRRLASIVESSEDIILSKTLDGVVTSWNGAAERIFGYTAEEMIGRSIAAIVPPDLWNEEKNILRRIRDGEQVKNYETRRRRKDGGLVEVSLTISPLRDAAGNIVGASKIGRDVSERKKAERHAADLRAELFHASRLSAMGRMTAAIAHEVNQPLTAVTNYVSAARRLLGAEQPAVLPRTRDMLEKAAEQALRAGAIIRNLRDFSEKRDSERSLENINQIVEEAVSLGLAGASVVHVAIDVRLTPDLPSLLIDKIQIQQTVLNLIRNAVEAMTGWPKRQIVVSSGWDGADFVHVTVADTGPGLPPHIAECLFEPFTTTKENGMGIGLNICRSIVEDHGGEIVLMPEVEEGAAFRIRLPVSGQIEGEA
ncbi:MAG TPA: PAS domain S-box protein [Rhizomicrobium sp.]|nr:PAS domain S-box protein [Rhizomicrobium sp.]